MFTQMVHLFCAFLCPFIDLTFRSVGLWLILYFVAFFKPIIRLIIDYISRFINIYHVLSLLSRIGDNVINTHVSSILFKTE